VSYDMVGARAELCVGLWFGCPLVRLAKSSCRYASELATDYN
jgi:hypothetical protein